MANEWKSTHSESQTYTNEAIRTQRNRYQSQRSMFKIFSYSINLHYKTPKATTKAKASSPDNKKQPTINTVKYRIISHT